MDVLSPLGLPHDTSVRVSDVLARPVFQGAQLLSGTAGLTHAIRWVHVLDIADAHDAIRGGELILSTGIGFRAKVGQEHDAFSTFVRQLIDGGAAGLCFELGTSFQDIPEDIVHACDKADFPLIVFPFHVRFVDITLDIHGLLLSRHHRLLDDLETVTRRFQALSTSTGAVQQTLALVHDSMRVPVLYTQVGQPPILFPATVGTDTSLVEAWTSALPKTFEATTCIVAPLTTDCASLAQLGDTLITQPIVVLGQIHGVLSVICAAEGVSEYLTLLLDRAASPLAQEAFRQVSLQERQHFHEQDWVVQLIRGERMVAQVERGQSVYRIAVIDFERLSAPSEEHIAWAHRDVIAMVRLALTQQRLRAYLAARQDAIVVLLQIAPSDTTWTARFEQSISQMTKARARRHEPHRMRVGVGVATGNLNHVKASFETAQEAIGILVRQGRYAIQHYDDAGIYRWISLVAADPRAKQLADTHLAQLRAYDALHRAHLLETLRVYLDYNGSKQQTAAHLYIHRQTLYHRLNQISDLLSIDLANPVERLSLHLALYFDIHADIDDSDI